MSVIDTLITDRKESDIAELNALLSRPLSEWTEDELTWFNQAASKGAYNYTDLNRVTRAMEYLNSLLAGYGYSTGYSPLEIEPGRTEWKSSDIPTRSTMDKYLRNVAALRSVMEMLPTTPETPPDMDGLTVSEANAIEQILSDIDYVVHHIFETMFRAGQFDAWSGHRPFPTANSNPGRTWGELDAMQTNWANWQAATWYLLLYGNLRAEGEVS